MKQNNLIRLSLTENYLADIGYDKGDDHYHYGFYAKCVLIIDSSDVLVNN